MRVTVPTLDDALLRCYEVILSSGASIGSTRGANREVVGAQIELTNPFARLSLSESRSTLYSCLGEFLWYLARSDDIGFIKYYAPKYAEFVDVIDGKVPEAYGPRLFAWHGVDQVKQVIELLRERSASRQAVIQLFDRNDLSNGRRDVPCTCTLQFLLRENRLDAITMMRSNDAVRGLPHDLFAFTMLQELIARSLGVEPGIYRHWVGSLHIYERDGVIAQALIAEGWQSTIGSAMPPMPEGNPWQYIKQLLEAEYAFRVERRAEPWGSTGSEYWDLLIWLLECLRHFKSKDLHRANAAWERRIANIFDPYIKPRLSSLQQAEVK